MTDTSQASLDRRQFLKTTLAVAGGVATFGSRQLLAADRKEPAHWAFLSDTHIAADPDDRHRGFYPYRILQEITGQLASNLPDGLVVAGDLARLKGRSGDYENVRKLLTPIAEKRPIHLATGNHDNRSNFLRAFADSGGRDWLVKGKRLLTVKTGPAMLILLDSLLFVDLPWGRLGHAQRAWLKTYLRASDNIPTVLFVHHPIKGRDALLDGSSLMKLVRPVAKVKAIVHGHSHQYCFREIDGIHVIGLPATGYNTRNEDAVGWVETHLTSDEGLFTLHAVDGNTRGNKQTQRLRWRT